MLLIILLSYFFLISSYFFAKFRHSPYGILPFIYIFLFLIVVIAMEFLPSGFFPGKEDQEGYYEFGLKCKNGEIGLEEAFKQYAIFYNALVCMVFMIDFFPKQTMILLNYIALLLITVFSYKTIYIITRDKERSATSAFVIGLLPSFLGFSIYMIRDLFIISFSSAFFYYLTYYYFMCKKTYTMKGLVLIIKIGITLFLLYTTRPHLSFIFFYTFLNIYLLKILGTKTLFMSFLISLFNYFWLHLLLGFVFERQILYLIIKMLLFDISFLKVTIMEVLFHLIGFGFVIAPEEGISFSKPVILITRLMAFDSIILPTIFLYFLLKGRFREFNIFIYVNLISYFLYMVIYLYASKYFEGGYGLHFRASMPYHYFFAIMILASIKINIKIRKFSVDRRTA